MQDFTPFQSLLGGALIGLSATLLLGLHGRVAGVSGIVGGALDAQSPASERSWRVLFLLGMGLGGILLFAFFPERFAYGLERTSGAIAVAGLLVGIGTRMGSGCTSGHGVCGISRRSPRSLAATGTFILTGAATVLVVRTFFGGAL